MTISPLDGHWNPPPAASPAAFTGDGSAASVRAAGSTTPRSLAARFADTVNVRDFGATGDGVTDDTAAINSAVAAAGAGGTVFLPAGAYRVTSTITLYNIQGLHLRGAHGRAYGTSGTRIVWAGGNATPVIRAAGLKQFTIEDLQIVTADTTANLATVGIAFGKQPGLTSIGPGVIRNVAIIGPVYGVQLGEPGYANDYNVSEVVFEDCLFDTRYGVFVAGTASGSQNVNNNFTRCHFGYHYLQYGMWFDGGHANLVDCTFNASASVYDATAFYFTGDRSMTQPIVIVGGYAEQIDLAIASEYTATGTQWFRSTQVSMLGGYYHCDRGVNQQFAMIYKTMPITLTDVQAVNGDVLYSPPPASGYSGYSANAVGSVLTLLGKNGLGTITTSRGGAVLSRDVGVDSTVPSGFMFPNTSTGELVLSAGAGNLPRQVVVLAAGSNGTYNLDTITGGQVGWELDLVVQYSYRAFTVRNNGGGTGNIRLAAGTGSTYALDAMTKRLTLRKTPSGKWVQAGLQED